MLLKSQVTEPYETVMRLAIHQKNGQTLFRCPRHGPMRGHAVRAPSHSCEYCWVMWLLKLEACTPPDQREELMDNLLRYMIGVKKLTERGDFDLDIPTSPLHTEVILDPSDIDAFQKPLDGESR